MIATLAMVYYIIFLNFFLFNSRVEEFFGLRGTAWALWCPPWWRWTSRSLSHSSWCRRWKSLWLFSWRPNRWRRRSQWVWRCRCHEPVVRHSYVKWIFFKLIHFYYLASLTIVLKRFWLKLTQIRQMPTMAHELISSCNTPNFIMIYRKKLTFFNPWLRCDNFLCGSSLMHNRNWSRKPIHLCLVRLLWLRLCFWFLLAPNNQNLFLL